MSASPTIATCSTTYKRLDFGYGSAVAILSTWMLTGFFNANPKELDEAATIDGCSRLQTFMGEFIMRWDPLTAGGVITALPFRPPRR